MNSTYYKYHFVLLASAVLLSISNIAAAKSISILLGPPAVGSGGTNPIAIPPVAPIQYEIQYINNNNTVYSLSIIPGAFVGKRIEKNGFFVEYGAGYTLSINGSGPGIYNSIGYITGTYLKLIFQFKQTLGLVFGEPYLISPSAFRIGSSISF